MWEFFGLLLKDYGLVSLIGVVELMAIVYLARQNQKQRRQIDSLHEKRVKDATENKEDYSELAHKLDQSIDLLIKVFKRNGG